MEPKIVSCKFVSGETLEDPTEVIASFDNGVTKRLLTFTDDNITFGPGELIGLTEKESDKLIFTMDNYYLSMLKGENELCSAT